MALITAQHFDPLRAAAARAMKWATDAINDRYDLETQLWPVAENLDLHTHEDGFGMPVMRLNTSRAPAKSGEVRVNLTTDTLEFHNGSALKTIAGSGGGGGPGGALYLAANFT